MVVGDRLWLFCAANNEMGAMPSSLISGTTSPFPTTANNLAVNPFASWNPYMKSISTTTMPAFSFPCMSPEYDQHSPPLSTISIDPYNSVLQQICPSPSAIFQTPFQYLPIIDQNAKQRVTFEEPLIIVAPEQEEISSVSNGLAELERVFGDSNVNFLNCMNKDNRFLDNHFISEDEHTDEFESKDSDIDCEQIDND